MNFLQDVDLYFFAVLQNIVWTITTITWIGAMNEKERNKASFNRMLPARIALALVSAGCVYFWVRMAHQHFSGV